jgi:hypothetical protein
MQEHVMARETDNPAQPYPSDYEEQRTPAQPGEPPRPATEPKGSEGSSDTPKTLTDPATGEPHLDR